MRQFCRRGSSAVIASILILVGITACGNLAAPAPPLGRATILVVDSATNAGIGNVLVTLVTTGGTDWAQLRTSSDGTGEFRASDGGVIIQGYVARLELPSGYTLAANETNDKPVVVVVGLTTTTTFKLHKVVVGGGGGGG
jgi:hypothetical protein